MVRPGKGCGLPAGLFLCLCQCRQRKDAKEQRAVIRRAASVQPAGLTAGDALSAVVGEGGAEAERIPAFPGRENHQDRAVVGVVQCVCGLHGLLL